MEPTNQPTGSYGPMKVAHRELVNRMPPGSPAPGERFIRRSVERGLVRVIKLGERRYLFNLDDVRALVTLP